MGQDNPESPGGAPHGHGVYSNECRGPGPWTGGLPWSEPGENSRVAVLLTNPPTLVAEGDPCYT